MQQAARGCLDAQDPSMILSRILVVVGPYKKRGALGVEGPDD